MQVGISKDQSLQTGFDIPTMGNTHQDQCNNPFYYIAINMLYHFQSFVASK